MQYIFQTTTTLLAVLSAGAKTNFKFKVGGSVVVGLLFIVTPIVGVCNCSMFCCTLLYVRSSIAIILMGKRELIALLNLSSWCLVMVERLFLAVPRGCLQFVIVVFPDHTHLPFLYGISGPLSSNFFITNDIVSNKIYDKRDDLKFEIIKFSIS